MKIFKVNPENLRDSEEAIIEAAKVMLKGGVVVFPTDTVYGLGCDATDEAAIRKVFRMKGRDKKKALAVVVRDIAMAKKISFIDKRLERALEVIWPGAVSVILWRRHKLPEVLTAGGEKIALRIPDYKLTYLLAENMGRPYVATSANLSGEQATIKISQVLEYFENSFLKPDLILDAGDLKFCEPSTVLDLSTDKPKIVRIGPVDKKKLLEILSI
ncbi:MAG TPA: threonylcarbamoyl-AMP synthase [Candidatus Portnoybacteria bacterium]|uniref:L-threonylcarbamoyladenylate synthase n=1 Tax=Candidatus Portnoybacteria bacterium CG02_land_8_20_14_3_00_45_8 TaxID=1974807 RepID=A0A2M7D624_9BACT|nr:MAG: threonylcarbamoyl-AMP synthase [Candidatus Portnoybacteria bacterium CG02_land_8_20_14_3_00_45_8]HCX27957.1 threonylcarbamoyl-AMP synthase [Candidatus Portnoybacteria bacterium]